MDSPNGLSRDAPQKSQEEEDKEGLRAKESNPPIRGITLEGSEILALAEESERSDSAPFVSQDVNTKKDTKESKNYLVKEEKRE